MGRRPGSARADAAARPGGRQAAGQHGQHVAEPAVGHAAARRPVGPAPPDSAAASSRSARGRSSGAADCALFTGQRGGTPLAGAACSVPVNLVTAPEGEVSVIITGPRGARAPFLIIPMKAPVMPSWFVEL